MKEPPSCLKDHSLNGMCGKNDIKVQDGCKGGGIKKITVGLSWTGNFLTTLVSARAVKKGSSSRITLIDII